MDIRTCDHLKEDGFYLERMAAFVLHGDPEAPLAPDEMPSLEGAGDAA